MLKFIKNLESIKRSLAKTELPERWTEESFQDAQALGKIIIQRLEKIVGEKIEVKPIELKITKHFPRLQQEIYVLCLERAIYKIPKELNDEVTNLLNDEEPLKKVKSLSKSIVRRLQWVNSTDLIISQTKGGETG